MNETTTTESGFSDETRSAFQEAIERGDAGGALDVLDADLDRRHQASAAAHSAEAAFHQPGAAKTTRGEAVSIPSAAELTLAAMQADGISESEALKQLATGDRAAITAEYADRITAATQGVIDRANLESDERYAETQEGKLAAARQAAEAREQRARDADLLRDHLAEQHASEADAISHLSDDEVFQLAGIEKSAQQLREEEAERRANDPAERQRAAERDLLARWWTLAPDQRQAAARELGADPAAVEAEAWRIAKSRGHA